MRILTLHFLIRLFVTHMTYSVKILISINNKKNIILHIFKEFKTFYLKKKKKDRDQILFQIKIKDQKAIYSIKLFSWNPKLKK